MQITYHKNLLTLFIYPYNNHYKITITFFYYIEVNIQNNVECWYFSTGQPKGHFTHEPRVVTMKLWEPKESV